MKNQNKLMIYLLVIVKFFLFLIIGCEKEAPVELANLSTLSVTEITSSSAKSGGNIINNGGTEVTSRGLVWGITANPSLEQHAGLTDHGSGTGLFTTNLSNLTSNTTYYVRSYAINSVGTAYGNEVQFTTQGEKATITTANVTDISSASATSGGNIISDGGSDVTVNGVCWSTSQNPTTSDNHTTDGSGTGTFTSNITDLSANTTYYVRAYATNSQGTAYGNQLEFTTQSDDERDWPRDTETEVVEVINPATGKVWMDRNLGASRTAISSLDVEAYGHYYQWGRAADGHQIRTSGTTSTLSSIDKPGHGHFITTNSNPYDWRSPQNDNLWQGENGLNNPCPAGFRLPTEAELVAERQSWSSNNAAGAFDSPLKLPLAGFRGRINGTLILVGSLGFYWSGTIDGSNSRDLVFNNTDALMYEEYRANGLAVRCIKN